MSQKTPARKSILIREITAQEEWVAMYALIKQQNKDMTRKDYNSLLKEMRARGYRALGAFDGAKLVGVMGFWVSYRFWCQKYIDIDNVIVDQSHRNRGIGKKLLTRIEKEGKRQNCDMAMLDSYVTAHQAHRFYYREGYVALGYHFTKHL